MKLLIVGSDKVYAIENFYVKYLKELGLEVSHFSAQSYFYDYYEKNLGNKLLFKSGISKVISLINKKFLGETERFRPDIVWIFKGMEITPESLQEVKTKNIKLVNYNPDSPFIFSGKGSGNENVAGSIKLYDLFLTYNLDDKTMMEKMHNIPSAILPFGFDVGDDVYASACIEKEKMKLCFLGNPDKKRAFFLQSLAEEGIVMDVFGNNWGHFVEHDNICIYEPVYKEEFWRILRRYRVQLNLMRLHNPASHNMRTFEAGGIGAIQLAPDTADHRGYYEDKKEIFLYSGLQSCIEQIDMLMKLPFQETLLIRNSARQKSLEKGYTYKERAALALYFLEKL